MEKRSNQERTWVCRYKIKILKKVASNTLFRIARVKKHFNYIFGKNATLKNIKNETIARLTCMAMI